MATNCRTRTSWVYHQHRLAVGIDLEQPILWVASVRAGNPDLNDEQERSLVPSVVHYGVEEKKVGL